MNVLIPGATGVILPEIFTERVTKHLDGTQVDVTNSTTITTAMSLVIPANSMGAHGCVRVQMGGRYTSTGATNRNVRQRIVFGGTEVWNDASAIATDSQTRPWFWTFILHNKGATNSQGMIGHLVWGGGAATTGIGNKATDETEVDAPMGGADPAKDTTLDQTLEVTMQQTTTDPGIVLRFDYALAELFQAPRMP